MARQAKDKSDAGGGLVISPETAKKAKPFLKRIESIQGDIDKIRADATEECAPHYEDIKEIKQEAHDAGIPRREFNVLIAQRKLLRRADSIRANLSEEQQQNLDQMVLALGDLADTELGRAARAREAKEPTDIIRTAH